MSDPLDNLLTETLRARLGPGPSSEVWARIQNEIAPPRRDPLAWLLALLRAPVVQSLSIVALGAVLLVQPAFYWMHNPPPPRPGLTTVTRINALPAWELLGDPQPAPQPVAAAPNAIPMPILVEAQ